jgi:alanyl-tRNA synthetase
MNVVAFVSDEFQVAGLKADEWVNSVVANYGGKGGGKSSQAQGSCTSNSSLSADAANYCAKIFSQQVKIIHLQA